jgi:hypothetical protein
MTIREWRNTVRTCVCVELGQSPTHFHNRQPVDTLSFNPHVSIFVRCVVHWHVLVSTVFVAAGSTLIAIAEHACVYDSHTSRWPVLTAIKIIRCIDCVMCEQMKQLL